MLIHGLRTSPRQGGMFSKHKEVPLSHLWQRGPSIIASAKGVVITGGNRGFG